jgi:zinc transport system substrate-binding protein
MLKSKKNTLTLAAVLLAAFAVLSLYSALTGKGSLAQLFNQRIDPDLSGGELLITASFYPLTEFAQAVGGQVVRVQNITPTGVEPHDFEPSPQDLVSLYNSQALIYNSVGFEPWIDKVKDDLIDEGVVLVDASKSIKLLEASEDDHDNEEEEDGFENDEYDPHVWLDPNLAIIQVENIKNALIELDPANASYYEQNARNYQNQLKVLDAEFQAGLATCATREIVTSHNAFQYLAKRYNLEVESISGLSPDEEPSPRRMAEITEFVRKNNVKYIFFETLVSPRLAETIAKETGAETIVFNPIEGLTVQELEMGKNYLSTQRDNLSALQKALQCD